MEIIRNDNGLNVRTATGKLILCVAPGRSSRPGGSARPDCGAALTRKIIEIIEGQLSSEVSVH